MTAAAKQRSQRRGGGRGDEQAPETRVAAFPASVPAQVGRPVVHTEPWAKITVVMLDHQVAYLDLVSICVRLAHHSVIPRAELVRAFIEFMERSGIDFSQFATEADIVDYMTDYFRCLPNGGRMPFLESSLFQDAVPARSRRAAEEDARSKVVASKT
jgi:hypothetical protein